jgi:AcrR family transcriptional regulator
MSTTSDRHTLEPTRERGKQRVEALLDAGAAVVSERGFEAATMAEIAASAGAHVGSLYRFFPNKEALADALVARYGERIDAAFAEFEDTAATRSLDAFSDALLDLFVTLHGQTRAASALLDTRADGSTIRDGFRRSLQLHVARMLQLRASSLPDAAAGDIAIVILQNMKAMVRLTVEPGIYASQGARDELRAMTRIYLSTRLAR